MRSSSEHARCVTALQALANGELDGWHGLPESCGRDEVEEALGPSATGPDGVGHLEGGAVAFRDYPPTAFSPAGITVWWKSEDEVAILQMNEPALTETHVVELGVPEKIVESGLHFIARQLVYASRGLTLHIVEKPFRPLRLYAYGATSAEEFLRSAFSRVEVRRHLRPEIEGMN